MGTKNNPGEFDCYAKAEPDEPLFVLLARDEHAAEVVRYWVALKTGIPPFRFWEESHDSSGFLKQCGEKLQEALICAKAMADWRKVNRP